MMKYEGIADDQIRAWAAFAALRKDGPHLTRMLTLLADRHADVEPVTDFSYKLDGCEIRQQGEEFAAIFSCGATVICPTLEQALNFHLTTMASDDDWDTKALDTEEHNVEA